MTGAAYRALNIHEPMGRLGDVARMTGGVLHGADVPFESVSTDTRALWEKQLFVALRGERYNALAFLEEALRRGAAGALVEQRQDLPLPQVVVADTRKAMGLLAREWRGRFRIPLVGITGSNGKTTVKEMTGAILRAAHGAPQSSIQGGSDAPIEPGPVLVTHGNLNNDVGCPLTLLWLRDFHQAAVIEMGASRTGDIDYLARLARPTVGLVTNAGPAHLEGFGGTVAHVAAGKGEMFAALETGATAVINRDDPFHDYWRGVNRAGRVWSFGRSPEADFRVSEEVAVEGMALAFRLETPAGATDIRIPMAGSHNVVNAAAAAAAAMAAGASLAAVRDGLAAMANVSGRLRPLAGLRQSRIYDDSYNANPGSVAAAIEFLAAMGGQRWLVLGEMAELGEGGASLHRAMGELAGRRGLDRLYCLGPLARAAAEAFPGGGRWFGDLESLTEAVLTDLGPGVTVLVKGSRRMGLERLVASLTGQDPATGGGH